MRTNRTNPRQAASKSTVNAIQRELDMIRTELYWLLRRLSAISAQLERSQRR